MRIATKSPKNAPKLTINSCIYIPMKINLKIAPKTNVAEVPKNNTIVTNSMMFSTFRLSWYYYTNRGGNCKFIYVMGFTESSYSLLLYDQKGGLV